MFAFTVGRTRAYVALVCIGVLGCCGCSSGGSSKATSTTGAPTSSTSTPAVGSTASTTTSAPDVPTTTAPPATTVPIGPPPTTPPTTPPTNPVVESAVVKAVQLVKSRGYTPHDTTDFTMAPANGLHVIIATATVSADGYAQQAFFFVNGHFLRTDLPGPSAAIQLAWRSDTTIALSYTVYKGDEPMCCPTGGAMIVRYQWTGTRLKALDPVPSATVRR